MIKVITAVALAATMAMAEVIAVDPNSNLGQAISNGSVSGATLITTPTNGVDGVDGTVFTTANKLQASSSAMDSVELNPDHKGWSVGGGYSNYNRVDAVALGVMYGTSIKEVDVGFNVKAYNAEAAYNGVGVGLTLGF